MTYGNNTSGGQPANNLWVGNNYSTSNYPQMLKNNYPTMNNSNNITAPFNTSIPSQPINNILRVMGPQSAQAYKIGPDSQVLLMDSDRPIFYLKRSDDSGYSETRAFEFHEVPLFQSAGQHNEPQEVQASDFSQYITKSEFEEFKKMIEDLVMKND